MHTRQPLLLKFQRVERSMPCNHCVALRCSFGDNCPHPASMEGIIIVPHSETLLFTCIQQARKSKRAFPQFSPLALSLQTKRRWVAALSMLWIGANEYDIRGYSSLSGIIPQISENKNPL